MDTGLRWVDMLRINNGPTSDTVPSYFELDARLAWHATKNLEFSIVGQNLLHDRHQEYGFPGSPTTEEIARSVYGKVYMAVLSAIARRVVAAFWLILFVLFDGRGK